MYTKLHTEGIILRARNVGESDRLFSIFTKDLGMVSARARGVRNLKSRQRQALQQMALIDVSFVRSKIGWRVTNVAAKGSLFSLCGKDIGKRVFVTRVCMLVRRLVVGEEANLELYTTIRSAFDFVFEHATSVDDLKTLEVLTALRVLHLLGYLKEGGVWDAFLLDTTKITPTLIGEVKKIRRQAVAEVNRALKETQL